MRTVWKAIRERVSLLDDRDVAGQEGHRRNARDNLPVPVGDGRCRKLDTETLSFLYEDARRVIDHQIEYLSDIDDKAMRTVRITTVLIAILLLATRLDSTGHLVNPLTVLGASFLLSSIGVGIFTYTASNTHFGPGSEYYDHVLANPRTAPHWRTETLRSYADWIENNSTVNARNGTYLLVCQLLLYIGILCVSAGIGVGWLGS